MIYTVTFAPAMDYYMQVKDLDDSTTIHRALSTESIVGGKGINVSKMLSILGVENTAIVFVGGTIGHWIVEKLHGLNHINVLPFNVDGESRINVKIRGKDEMDINASGPTIASDTLNALLNWFDQMIKPEDMVVFSGALSNGMTMQWLYKYSHCIHAHHGKVVLDIASLSLNDLKTIKADLIKPNHDELMHWFNHEYTNDQTMLDNLLSTGTTSILLSMGQQGAIYIDDQYHRYRIVHPPLSNPVDTTACGDAMLAGFLAGLDQHIPLIECLKQACACGFASANVIGLADEESVGSVINLIDVAEYACQS